MKLRVARKVYLWTEPGKKPVKAFIRQMRRRAEKWARLKWETIIKARQRCNRALKNGA